MNDETVLGIMYCPNCNRQRSTGEWNIQCICGYNPLTHRVEEVNFKKDESKEPLKIPEIQVLPKENNKKSDKTWEQMFKKLCIKANVNWLQYIIIKQLYVFDYSETAFDALFNNIKIGMTNDIYNGVPRLCQGNRVLDLAPEIKVYFNDLTKDWDGWKKQVAYNVLVNYYDVAYLIIEKL